MLAEVWRGVGGEVERPETAEPRKANLWQLAKHVKHYVLIYFRLSKDSTFLHPRCLRISLWSWLL